MKLISSKASKFFGIALLAIVFSTPSNAQITVNGNSPYNTAAYLVQNVLLGQGVTASNFSFTGAATARGFFGGISTNLNLDSGLIMTSGDIANAPGPNNNSSAATILGLPGDPDLDIIMSPTLSYDACILQFDFIPNSDTVKFRYVFGSDEYMEWVSNSPGGINDGFGFFLSGPGIAGPFSNNAANIALIPGTGLPVTMFNLNLNNHPQYYFDNGDGNGTGTAPNGPDVQYDGFTHVMTAKHWVQCGQTYHIKIAIGDGGDGWIDSGVFLEAGSFASAGVIVGAASGGSNINGNDSVVYEGCGSLVVYFNRGADTLTQDTVQFTIAGTATNGTDYANINNQVIFPIGDDSVGITISPFQDGITEPTETIYIILTQGGPCNSQTPDTIVVYIKNVDPPVVNVNSPTVCTGDPAIMTASASGGMPGYTYTWSNNLGNGTSATVSPLVNSTYTVTVRDTCGNVVTQTVNVTVTHPTAEFTYDYATPSSIDFHNASSSNVVSWSWTFGDGNSSTATDPSHTYPNDQTYTFFVTLYVVDANGCRDSIVHEITVYPDFYFYTPNAFTPNHDNRNTTYGGVGSGIESYRMIIFDRWGQKLFTSNDINVQWDGKVNGTLVQEDVYIAVFDVKGPLDQEIHKVTHVTVIR